ncbi:hypothetical protein KF6_095 [Vibrio phage vB_VpaS_KF6]|uniref:Uncharacterized protein n=1 Tax=Vibrio phage vB_VpaS_KF6 TaxID=2041477 RepID=A0A384WK92_9CAUD|nr:hypothetical protein KF6_095 [Vibrio phage vB_VpaS_KF6]
MIGNDLQCKFTKRKVLLIVLMFQDVIQAPRLQDLQAHG